MNEQFGHLICFSFDAAPDSSLSSFSVSSVVSGGGIGWASSFESQDPSGGGETTFWLSFRGLSSLRTEGIFGTLGCLGRLPRFRFKAEIF